MNNVSKKGNEMLGNQIGKIFKIFYNKMLLTSYIILLINQILPQLNKMAVCTVGGIAVKIISQYLNQVQMKYLKV